MKKTLLWCALALVAAPLLAQDAANDTLPPADPIAQIRAELAAQAERIAQLQAELDATKAAQTSEETPAQAEPKKEKLFQFKFYGRVRGDLSYNTRTSQESVDGLFYMYPLDVKNDPNDKDINAMAAGNFYMLYTRLGVDIAGPNIGKATTAAKIEMDFRGSGTTFAIPRLRQAYLKLGWGEKGKSEMLFGQTWHPLTGDVTPTMLNLSTGAPFQPFSRTPQVRYRFQSEKGLQLTAAALWQMQYNSAGPDGKSYKYLKNSCVPELYIGIDYKKDGWIAGVGGEMISLRPRQTSAVGDSTYKVNERITTFSAEAHVRYKADMWSIAAKGTYGENLAHCSMLGGYAVSAIDATTGEQQYTPYRHASAWMNFVYGKKWQPAAFIGYTKNLGTTKEIVGKTYGTGLDIDQLLSANVTLTYNLPHWKIGAEFETSTAWYGTADTHGKISDTHAITNYRVLGVVMFVF